MSFLLELAVARLTEEQGRAVQAAATRRGTWPIAFVPPRRRRARLLRPRPVGPALRLPDQLPDGRHLLTEDAVWDAPAWDMDRDLLPRLAEAVHVLDEHLPQGFALRATWGGSEVRTESTRSADQLAAIVRRSELNEFTRYRVPGREVRTDPGHTPSTRTGA